MSYFFKTEDMSNNSNEDLNIEIYRRILFHGNGENIFGCADTRRKCLVQMFEAASVRMGNASVCELLKCRLEDYTTAVYKDEENIYNTLLKQTSPDISSDHQLKVSQNLEKLDLNSYLKDLGCSSSKNALCSRSEQISKAELEQFENLFQIKKEIKSKCLPNNQPKHSLESRFENLDKLQSSKQNLMGKENLGRNFNKKHNEFIKKEPPLCTFSTARDELEIQAFNRVGMGGGVNSEDNSMGVVKKKLGMRRGARSKFVSPLLSKNESLEEIDHKVDNPILVDERLKNIEPKMVELIMGEIMDQGPNIQWNDIAGLEFAKSAIQEAVVWPMLRPDIFTGLRRPPKGILLFGPPGTGKTLIGKCVASQSKSTFFSISASSLTSKWIGDGEKMVRALFAVARVHQPAVIFIDEVDSLLTQRSDTEHESSRRIKTEFLVQLDGATTDSEERLLVIGATNRPQELDEAARRRFVKRLYIPLPEEKARLELVKKLMEKETHTLTNGHFQDIARLSDGYSGADIKNLCSEASLGPIRSIDFNFIEKIQASEVRPLSIDDFEKAFKRVRPSVSQNDLIQYIKWDNTYGSGSS